MLNNAITYHENSPEDNLHVIANAPNPAGIGILQKAKAFENEGISRLGLFVGALPPTAVAVIFFWLLH